MTEDLTDARLCAQNIKWAELLIPQRERERERGGNLHEAASWHPVYRPDRPMQLQASEGLLQAAAPGPSLPPQIPECGTGQGHLRVWECSVRDWPGIGGLVYTTKFPASAQAHASLFPPLGGRDPAYVHARQGQLHWGVSNGNWKGHFLGQEGQAVVIHEGN